MIRDMNHPAAERLEAYAEGSLGDGDRVIIESHLLACAECQASVEEWRTLFSALTGLIHFEPSTGFADRVMARVRIAPVSRPAWSWQTVQTALQVQAVRTGRALGRLMPESAFGWTIAMTVVALPFLVMGALLTWLMSRSYITPTSLWAFLSTEIVEGARSIGTTAVSTAMQTELAAWLYGYGVAFLERAGVTGVGLVVGVAGLTTMLSIWVLYKNLFRTPTRETNYASYSI
jgi:hypothetical protein